MSNMRYADKNLETVGELVDALKNYGVSGTNVWYRGQINADWKLVPSIARNADHLHAESTIIKVFKQNARPHLRERPETEWEWFF